MSSPASQILADAVVKALGDYPAKALAGLAVLTDVDMGTLDVMYVESASEIHTDEELFLLANEWEATLEIVNVELSDLVSTISGSGRFPGAKEPVAALIAAVDQICIDALRQIKTTAKDRFSDDAIFVYSHIYFEVEDYIAWFTELNAPARVQALERLLSDDQA